MYCILVYDVASEKTGKMLRLCRKYLNWIQNSVFEGNITQIKLQELIFEAKKIMNEEVDSLIIFTTRDENWLYKQVIGKDKNPLDTIL